MKKVWTGVKQKVREVQAIGDFTDEACVKATNNNLKKPKEKHVRTLIHYSNGREGVSLEKIVKKLYVTLHSTTDWNVVLKTLELFHSLVQRGFDQFSQLLARIQLKKYAYTEVSKDKMSPLRISKKYRKAATWPPERKNFFSLADWEDRSALGQRITPYIHRYARYVQSRLRLYTLTRVRHFRVTINLHEKQFRSLTEILTLIEPFQRLLQRFLDMQLDSFFRLCDKEGDYAEIISHSMNLLIIDSLVMYKVLNGLVMKFLKMFFREEKGGAKVVQCLERGLQVYERHIIQMDRMLDLYRKIKQNIFYRPVIQLPDLKAMKGRNIIQTMKKKISEIRSLNDVVETNIDEVFDDDFPDDAEFSKQVAAASPSTPTNRRQQGSLNKSLRSKGGQPSPVSYRASPSSPSQRKPSSLGQDFAFKAPPLSRSLRGGRRSRGNSTKSSPVKTRRKNSGLSKTLGASPRTNIQRKKGSTPSSAPATFEDDDFFSGFNESDLVKPKTKKSSPKITPKSQNNNASKEDDFFSFGGGKRGVVTSSNVGNIGAPTTSSRRRRRLQQQQKKQNQPRKQKIPVQKQSKPTTSSVNFEDDDFFDQKPTKTKTTTTKKKDRKVNTQKSKSEFGFDDDDGFFNDFDTDKIDKQIQQQQQQPKEDGFGFDDDDDFFENQPTEASKKKEAEKKKSGMISDDDFFGTSSFGDEGGDDDFFSKGFTGSMTSSTSTTATKSSIIAPRKQPVMSSPSLVGGSGGVTNSPMIPNSNVGDFFSGGTGPPSRGGMMASPPNLGGVGMGMSSGINNSPMMTPPQQPQKQPVDAFMVHQQRQASQASPFDIFQSLESSVGSTSAKEEDDGANPFDEIMNSVLQSNPFGSPVNESPKTNQPTSSSSSPPQKYPVKTVIPQVSGPPMTESTSISAFGDFFGGNTTSTSQPVVNNTNNVVKKNTTVGFGPAGGEKKAKNDSFGFGDDDDGFFSDVGSDNKKQEKKKVIGGDGIMDFF